MNTFLDMNGTKMAWLVQVRGKWQEWKPLPGLDKSLGEAAMWVGAAQQAAAKAHDKPDMICHQVAEKAAQAFHQRVKQ